MTLRQKFVLRLKAYFECVAEIDNSSFKSKLYGFVVTPVANYN